MKTKNLTPFEKTALTAPFSITCGYELLNHALLLEWEVTGPLSELIIPPASLNMQKTDGLYKHTCFEVFIKGMKDSYLEWNFSPSGDWCGFAFESYRVSASEMEVRATNFETIANYHKEDSLFLSVKVDWGVFKSFLEFPKKLQIGFSTVLEHKKKSLTYWALKHPGEKPDFHHEEGFAIILTT